MGLKKKVSALAEKRDAEYRKFGETFKMAIPSQAEQNSEGVET